MSLPIDVLVVDDNPDVLAVVSSELRRVGYQVRTAQDGVEGWVEFRSRRPDLVVSDIRMPNQDGIELLRRIREVSDVPVILLTAQADLSAAVSALRGGATDFLRFPDELEQLSGRAQALLPGRGDPEPDDEATALIRGDAPGMRELRSRVRALAGLDVPVLVSGEVGTGRMQVVRALHALSGEIAPLVVIRPAEDGAPRKRCAVALVELTAWPSEQQALWAAALRGDAASKFSRLYAIAEPSLAAGVDRLEFRRDLWVRFSRFRLDVPPLRARSQDIPTFAREALAEITSSMGRGALLFTLGALDSLRKRPWPGNLPELREALVQAVAFAKGARIDRSDLDRAVEAVIAAREDSLPNRRAEKTSADRQELIALLSECGGNIAEIARRLDMTRGAVSYRLRKHGLTR
jgi:DNA-binding NtrC family response regulator